VVEGSLGEQYSPFYFNVVLEGFLVGGKVWGVVVGAEMVVGYHNR
jgi:hypothetical protein